MKAANKTKHVVHPVLRVSARFMHFDSSSNVCYSFTITPCFNKSVVCVGVSLITSCIRFCVCPHGSCTLTLDPMCVIFHNHTMFQRECCMRWCVIDARPFHMLLLVLNTVGLKHLNTTICLMWSRHEQLALLYTKHTTHHPIRCNWGRRLFNIYHWSQCFVLHL